jgi:hypothetical protein
MFTPENMQRCIRYDAANDQGRSAASIVDTQATRRWKLEERGVIQRNSMTMPPSVRQGSETLPPAPNTNTKPDTV